MAFFLTRLNYSFGNEDWRTEQEALRIQPDDHVLCITASGDRPLNLLLNDCSKILCVDANPYQNYLLELKCAAMRQLTFEHYLAFLGVTPTDDRLKTLSLLLPCVSREASQFWRKNQKMVAKGIIYQGTVERLTKLFARSAAIFRRKKIQKLFAATDIEEQRKLVNRDWDNLFFRKFFQLFLNPFVSRWLIEDPGLKNIGKSVNPGIYIYEKMQASLQRELARNNLLFSLLLKGEVLPDAYPPYIQKEAVSIIKTRLSRLEIHSVDVITYLKSLPAASLDVFSLSDVASYISPVQFVELLREMIRVAKPNARFCLRQFLTLHEIPQQFSDNFRRDQVLEKKLEHQDNCFVYRFLVGTINLQKVSSQLEPSLAWKQ